MRLTINAGGAVTEEHRAMLRQAIAAGFTDPRLTERHIQTLIKYGPQSPLLQDCNGIFPLVPASLFEAAQEYLIEMDDEAEALAKDREEAEYEAERDAIPVELVLDLDAQAGAEYDDEFALLMDEDED